jgi:hypothetical protein
MRSRTTIGKGARKLLVCAAAAGGAILAWSGSAGAGTVQGTLATTQGDSITSDQLRDWINEFITAANQRLVVMTQCFGGNSATSFAGQGNTSVISATSPGQESTYGGYDDDAAGALAPGAGNTGATVHAAGTAGKDASETPSTGGGLAPGGFSLAPVPAAPVPADPIHSRHVLVYAGQPDGGGGTSDVAQRDAIAANFAGQPNTTVTSAGGAGGGGWSQPGSAAGLRNALKSIGTAINASANPAKEQFILFVTDHGDLHNKESKSVVSPQNTTIPLTPSSPFQSFGSIQLDPDTLANDPNNQPGFSVFLPFHDGTSSLRTAPYDPFTPFFPPNCWQMGLDNPAPTGTDWNIPSFFDVFVELDDSGVVGDFPGEGVRVMFKLPPPDNSMFFVDSFFDVFYDVSLTNFTNFTPRAGNYLVTELSQDSGTIAKLPEPAGALALAAGCALTTLMRRRRQGN